jgi:hypothetical protein
MGRVAAHVVIAMGMLATVVAAEGCADARRDGPAQCAAAGGRCLLGPSMGSCAETGPFDCNPDRNPGGAACCLKMKAESPINPGAAGAGGTSTGASGAMSANASGPAQCVAGGGRCVLGNAASDCAEQGPFECNPDGNPGGAFCCLKFKPGSRFDASGAAGAGGATAGPAADGGAAAGPDYSCNEDEDCVIKDVHNCCGAYPRCVNQSSATPPPVCPAGVSSVCGWPDIDSCTCKENRCRSMQSGNEV